MVNYWDLLSSKEECKVSLVPFCKILTKRVLIAAPPLLCSSVALAEDVPKAVSGVKDALQIAKITKKVTNANKTLKFLNKVGGLYLGHQACKEGGKNIAKGLYGPVSPATAAAAFIFTFLCGAFVTVRLLEEE